MREHELALPQGKLTLTWELYRHNVGNTITIQTGAPTRLLFRHWHYR